MSFWAEQLKVAESKDLRSLGGNRERKTSKNGRLPKEGTAVGLLLPDVSSIAEGPNERGSFGFAVFATSLRESLIQHSGWLALTGSSTPTFSPGEDGENARSPKMDKFFEIP